jgi:hypothetical protein
MPAMPKPGRTNISTASSATPATSRISSSQPASPRRKWLPKKSAARRTDDAGEPERGVLISMMRPRKPSESSIGATMGASGSGRRAPPSSAVSLHRRVLRSQLGEQRVPVLDRPGVADGTASAVVSVSSLPLSTTPSISISSSTMASATRGSRPRREAAHLARMALTIFSGAVCPRPSPASRCAACRSRLSAIIHVDGARHSLAVVIRSPHRPAARRLDVEDDCTRRPRPRGCPLDERRASIRRPGPARLRRAS